MVNLMRICVLLPAFNEANNIDTIINAIKAQRLDVLVVDDGSADETNIIAGKLADYVIRHKANMGKGYSIREGISFILDKDYEAAVIMDAIAEKLVIPGLTFLSITAVGASILLSRAQKRKTLETRMREGIPTTADITATGQKQKSSLVSLWLFFTMWESPERERKKRKVEFALLDMLKKVLKFFVPIRIRRIL